MIGLSVAVHHRAIKKYEEAKKDQMNFIWNDDDEAIPPDGSLIVIEFTRGNDVYIGSVEANTDTDSETLLKEQISKNHKE